MGYKTGKRDIYRPVPLPSHRIKKKQKTLFDRESGTSTKSISFQRCIIDFITYP